MMSDEKLSKSGKMSNKDIDLWKEMTKDVKRFEGRDYVRGEDRPEKELSEESESGFEALVKETAIVPPEKKQTEQVKGQDVDRRTEEKLRKGQMNIEARLDMHGMSQDEAKEALEDFIKRCHGQQRRCVLVITGKGRAQAQDSGGSWLAPEPGILKRRTPEWLSEEKMKVFVLKFVPAQRKDGGDGALYVLLRRHRAS